MVIPVNEPFIGEKEFEYVNECLRTGWISSEGRFISEFEKGWAAYCGMNHGVAVSNGTVALEIAIAAINLEPGDEVILPTFTIISCGQAVTMNDLVPVLVDSDPLTWCMDTSQIEAKITPRTRAIMPVHIYGHPVDMDPVLELAKKFNLFVIEDAAEVHGAEYKGRKCGGIAEVSCFSFYANKIITTGEGGMVLTRDESTANELRSLRNLCFQKDRRYYHTRLGHNYRLSNVQAAIGLAQLERIETSVEKKRWIGHSYNERLAEVETLQLPIEQPWAKNVYWMYGIVLDEKSGMDAKELANRLNAKGVVTRPFFLGMHEQPAFQAMGFFQGEHHPVAERIARQGLYLPTGMTLTESHIDQVCEAVKQVLYA